MKFKSYLITDFLDKNRKIYPDDSALVEIDPENKSRREISWEEFGSLSGKIASYLMKNGIKKGDTIGHLMMNSMEWLPVYFGILKSGAIAVPLNFRFMAKTIKNCINMVEAKAVFFDETFIERIDDIRNQLFNQKIIFIFTGPEKLTPEYSIHIKDVFDVDEEKKLVDSVEIYETDDAAMYFTSGTTGDPKAVLLTHDNLAYACDVEQRHHNQTKEDIFLCIPPLYHTGAKMHWFGSLKTGGKGVILKGTKPEYILEAVSSEKVSIVWLLVPWAHDILVAIENKDVSLENYDLSRWRLMHMGAQPVPETLIRKWEVIFPSHDYDTNYGLTEASGPGCVHFGNSKKEKIGAIGLPGYGWEYNIVYRNMEPVPTGEPGELVVKGRGVMKEYYKNPEATEKTIVDGWLRTGDIARQDKDGCLWLLDRKKDVIITGGENIFPAEIEAHILSHPKVHDVAVIGTPDKRLGELVTAIVQVKKGMDITEDEIKEFCSSIPRYRRPRIIHFDDVPRNPTGKIQKPELRKKFTGIYSSFKRDFKDY
ncbi:MAG: AMP-dependent synthetase [Deltaproteobacteria bacterium]|nr:MAG: AMP-dependent synthetase [Deltaproteobacteria bacterium]